MYLEKLIEKIPEGVILVFPNLNLMEKCKYAWFEVKLQIKHLLYLKK